MSIVRREQWRPLRMPEYENAYVSSLGRIRRETGKLAVVSFRGKYPSCTLRVGSNYKTCHIHVLVANAFLGARPLGLDIRHIDGDAHNSRVSNLTYGTRSENQLDRRRHGTSNQGEACGSARLATEDIQLIRKLDNTYSYGVLAKQYGVARSTIQAICERRSWQHVQ